MTKKGNTQYVPLRDGDEIDLGGKTLIVKDFPGHTPGSITLLDPAMRFIYAGDASDIDIWMFTNPDCSLHDYAVAITKRSRQWGIRSTAARICR